MTPDALAALHARAFSIPPPWPARDFAAYLGDPACLVLTRQNGSELRAFAVFRSVADEAELLTLATVPEARRAGHARALLQEGFARLSSAGIATCFLEVAQDNAPARALYAGLGFMQAGRRPGYYRALNRAPVDALILRAVLFAVPEA